ncbi:hypothetical protein CDIK_1924 [Cucumispora dikerogammari]|nr:hypothetical protein CDIK_1924 [Cucumispora dikerogammari]
MSILNLFQITINSTAYITKTHQTKQKSRSYTQKEYILIHDLITKKIFSRETGEPKTKNFKLNDFKLNPFVDGNSILFPLLELKNEDGIEILPDFEELIDFNQNRLLGYFSMKNQIELDGIIEFKEKTEDTPRFFLNNGIFFSFKNPSSGKLTLYLFVSVGEYIIFKLENNVLKIRENEVDCFCFSFPKSLKWPRFTMKAKQDGKTEEYYLEFPDVFRNISFRIDTLNDCYASLLDNNEKQIYVSIKPSEINPEGKILKNNLNQTVCSCDEEKREVDKISHVENTQELIRQISIQQKLDEELLTETDFENIREALEQQTRKKIQHDYENKIKENELDKAAVSIKQERQITDASISEDDSMTEHKQENLLSDLQSLEIKSGNEQDSEIDCENEQEYKLTNEDEQQSKMTNEKELSFFFDEHEIKKIYYNAEEILVQEEHKEQFENNFEQASIFTSDNPQEAEVADYTKQDEEFTKPIVTSYTNEITTDSESLYDAEHEVDC